MARDPVVFRVVGRNEMLAAQDGEHLAVIAAPGRQRGEGLGDRRAHGGRELLARHPDVIDEGAAWCRRRAASAGSTLPSLIIWRKTVSSQAPASTTPASTAFTVAAWLPV